MALNKKVNLQKIPKHIGIIMDGNGRWAVKRGFIRSVGHKYGYAKMLTAIQRCSEYGIKVCSIYAFSTENWNRPKQEVDEIFRIIRENMERDTPKFMEWNIKVVTMGDITKFPDDLQSKLTDVIKETKNNTGTILNLCVNYGGRADIVQAVNKILKSKAKQVTEQNFGDYLYGADLPPPDLIVRTSGEQRVSNFMLWQMAYSEFLFIKQLWPDITPKTIDKCLLAFQNRKRRFGKLG